MEVRDREPVAEVQFIGPKANTIGTIGFSFGPGIGGAYMLVENLSLAALGAVIVEIRAAQHAFVVGPVVERAERVMQRDEAAAQAEHDWLAAQIPQHFAGRRLSDFASVLHNRGAFWPAGQQAESIDGLLAQRMMERAR